MKNVTRKAELVRLKNDSDRRLKKIEDEEWRIIPGSDGKFEVSNYGRIKSYLKSSKGKILKFASIKGFHTVSLKINGITKTHLVHKIVAEVFNIKPSEDCTVVTHIDWNIRNNNAKNLEWIPRKKHYERLVEHNKEVNKARGYKIITNSKLKADDVKRIKAMIEKGITQNLIAKMFCVSEMQITRIKRGENWGEIKSQAE
jgi:hypothetical protein